MDWSELVNCSIYKDAHSSILNLTGIYDICKDMQEPMSFCLPFFDMIFPQEAMKAQIRAIAKASDKWKGNAYHSSFHCTMVAIHAMKLADFHNVKHDLKFILCITALLHDYKYAQEITKSGPKGFMEEQSIIMAFNDGILSQDVKLIKNINSYTVFPDNKEDVLPVNDIRRILANADLISSYGLGVKYFKHSTKLIEKEFNTTFTLDAKINILNLAQKVFIPSLHTVFDVSLKSIERALKEERY